DYYCSAWDSSLSTVLF
nr:immunoglobulin light chain junction region [Macaca mulatta]MOX77547.1 immunoglobulin light chain junction region [Macaca mulatta]MOX77609.1 immunoglobulin light chain junction region [Macaca mulatta]MOX78025.1 immunoglobulin light chain junction region [Macaca mulatta]MOX78136.1 immunoglobulin light chain junction region [Macaca mulatta]